MLDQERTNLVRIEGKLTKVMPLRYTPNGLALLEVIVAANQSFLGEMTVGYFEVLFGSDKALQMVGRLKVGRKIKIEGELWSRRYRDRGQNWITEKKIIAHSIEEES